MTTTTRAFVVARPRPIRAAFVGRGASAGRGARASNEAAVRTATVEVALKEWAVVVDALGRGAQIAIARKGGGADAKGGFTPR